ncbi:MAG: DUF3524 domain-containing protein [Pseudomonadota bacterium]|nr:DUF3524 domain-containing protein [Pseudomonadota bacterium]
MKPLVWLLSAYRSDSHASWADWLTRQDSVTWQCLELPGRHFRWRIRGNPLSWLDTIPELLQSGIPDRILATSMVDISTLKGLHPALSTVPVSLYFHENQFAYPQGQGQHSSIDPQMVQLYGALAADECLFNSQFNLDSMLAGVSSLLARLPDEVPASVVERIAAKSRVLPVPVESVSVKNASVKSPALEERPPQAHPQAPVILWNHRWEYDKRPDRFVQMLEHLEQQQVPFRLALLGPRAENRSSKTSKTSTQKKRLADTRAHDLVQSALASIRARYADRIAVDGRVSRDDYVAWLRQSSVVFGCADHEFQGVSLIEATSAGAIPVVPDALCYPEQYPADCRYPPGDMSAAADAVALALAGNIAAPDIAPWLTEVTAAQWHDWLLECGQASRARV